jgi:hypothetical protein
VLLVSPVWLLLGWLSLELLLRLWRVARIAESDLEHLSRVPVFVAGLVALAGSGYGGFTMTSDGWNWFIGHGLWLFGLMIGFGHVTVSLVLWRLWFAFRPRASFAWGAIPVFGLMWVCGASLAISSAYTGSTAFATNVLALMGYPGFYGIPTAIILGILRLEAARAVRRARSATGPGAEGPPGLPTP